MAKKGKQTSKAQVPQKKAPGPNNQKKSRSTTYDSAPVSKQIVQKMTKASITSSSMPNGDARIRVRHREFIQDITGSVAFSVQQLSINPGLVQMFPWLSSIAKNYESYRFHKLKFEYETMQSTAQVGKLLMAVDYDASDSAPASKTELMAHHDSVSSAVWQECEFSCDPKDLNKFGTQRYIRQGVVASTDIKTYDVGDLNIATQGVTNAPVIGEVYVTYDVELMTPQVGSLGNNGLSARADGNTAITKALIFGTAPTVVSAQSPITVSGNTVTFVTPGQYLIESELTGTVLIVPGLSGTATLVATAVALVNTAATFTVDVLLVTALANQTLIFDATGSTSVTAFRLRVADYLASNA